MSPGSGTTAIEEGAVGEGSAAAEGSGSDGVVEAAGLEIDGLVPLLPGVRLPPAPARSDAVPPPHAAASAMTDVASATARGRSTRARRAAAVDRPASALR